jgi:hypothetical protein
MVNISDTGPSIIIEIDKNPGYEELYNRDYFSLLDLEIINSSDVEVKRGGKSSIDAVIDHSENIVDSSVKTLNEKMGSLVDKTETRFNSVIGNAYSQKEVFQLEIKKTTKEKTIGVETELASFLLKPKSITSFKSGLKYGDLEKIIKDVYIQLSYIDFLNIEISGLSVQNIYKINNRYVFVTNSTLENKTQENERLMIRELQKLIIELTGEIYENGNSLEKMKLVEKTNIYKFLQRLNNGIMNVW